MVLYMPMNESTFNLPRSTRSIPLKIVNLFSKLCLMVKEKFLQMNIFINSLVNAYLVKTMKFAGCSPMHLKEEFVGYVLYLFPWKGVVA